MPCFEMDSYNPNLQVVLRLEEGNGFAFTEDPVLITATLNGVTLETLPKPSKNALQLQTELVWEVQKKTLKIMRGGNAPIKLECYTTSVNRPFGRNKIGYLMLNVRSAPMLAPSETGQAKMSWHKFLGLRSDIRSFQPELRLSLFVEDKDQAKKESTIPPLVQVIDRAIDVKISNVQTEPVIIEPNPSPEPIIIKSNLQPEPKDTNSEIKEIEPETAGKESITMDSYSTFPIYILPRLCTEEGLIQIGPDELCSDIYLVTILLGNAINLDALLPSDDAFYNPMEYYTFVYGLFNNSMQTKPFRKLDNGTYNLNEKMVLRVRSSIKLLREYFNYFPNITLKLRYGDYDIGNSNFCLANLIETDSLTEFLARYTSSQYTALHLDTCVITKINEIPQTLVANDDTQSSVKLGFSIKYIVQKGIEVAQQYSQERLLADNVQHEVNHMRLNVERSAQPKLQADMESVRMENKIALLQVKEKMDNFVVQNVTATNLEPIEITVTDNIHMGQDKASDDILDLVEKSTHKLDERTKPTSSNNKPESKSSTSSQKSLKPHLETITEEVSTIPASGPCHRVASVSPESSISSGFSKARGSGDKIDDQNFKTDELLKNDQITYKIVEELEDWKEKQQQIFLAAELQKVFVGIEENIALIIENDKQVRESYDALKRELEKPLLIVCLDKFSAVLKYIYVNQEKFLWMAGLFLFIWHNCFCWSQEQFLCLYQLKQKEGKHLGFLSTEWYKKRIEIEVNLNAKMEQCRSLAAALEQASSEAKTTGCKNKEIEKQLSYAKEELDRHYNAKYLDLKEASRRLEADLNHKLTRTNLAKTEMSERVKTLQLENERLKEAIQQQREEYEYLKANSLNKEQTATLLHQLKTTDEKLIVAQKSKSFFKDQWAKACREVHRIKSDHQENIHVQIRKNKAHGLCNVLMEEDEDAQELQNIKSQLQETECNSSGIEDCQTGVLDGVDYFKKDFSSRSSYTDESDFETLEARRLLEAYQSKCKRKNY